ncbi:MAG: hypothetical protein ACI8R9_001405 [Paraglaciecola sp.]|jgi:hypothetical protein
MRYNGENDEIATIYLLSTKDIAMNKKKKLTQIHQKRLKAAKAKLGPKKKGSYISKAERAKLENSETLDMADNL